MNSSQQGRHLNRDNHSKLTIRQKPGAALGSLTDIFASCAELVLLEFGKEKKRLRLSASV